MDYRLACIYYEKIKLVQKSYTLINFKKHLSLFFRKY